VGAGCTQIGERATGHRGVYCRRKPIEKANSFEAFINERCACIDIINISAALHFPVLSDAHFREPKVFRSPPFFR
jgi:hypothetical protein